MNGVEQNGNGKAKNDNINNSAPKLYTVHVSKSFLIVTILICTILSYTAGRVSHLIVLSGSPPSSSQNIPNSSNNLSTSTKSSLPSPRLIDGKTAPHTLYTSKNFDTAASATTSSVHLQQEVNLDLDAGTKTNTNSCRSAGNDKTCSSDDKSTETTIPPNSNSNSNSNPNATNNDDKEEHLPAGQHLLVDIKNVDSTFLNSETRLAHAMVDVVNESKLTLLSYHCHSLLPMGVSCVGVLLESHVSFHTWPEEGVITLDLFTCGSGELVPVLPLIEKAFAIPTERNMKHTNEKDGSNRNDSQGDYENEYEFEQPVVVWSHKLRGFRSNNSKSIWGDDIGRMIVESTSLDLKHQIATTKTPFQRIHVYDVIRADSSDLISYTKSLSTDGSYQSLHPQYYKPDRLIFLDGVLQSTRYGNEAYHEALVQPAMFAHPNPKNVGIIGGGEGATLREVLKHNTLEKVVMIEIDEEMVKFSRENLPDWCDCSDFVGSEDWCGDDKRADLRYEDGAAWFGDRFTKNRKMEKEYQEDPFDILIMDALDPQDNIPFADLLYTNIEFLQSLYNSLSTDGIIVMQLGEAPTIHSPPEKVSRNSKRGKLMEILSKAGFKSMHIYEESHCGFQAPWSFLVGMKSETSRKNWYRTGADLEIDIHQRMIKTKSGVSPIKHFDGATMTSYQLPSKAFESVFCKASPKPSSCEKDINSSQAVRRSRHNPFDLYLDRHTYDKNDGDDDGDKLKSILCDYFYYNGERLKYNTALDYEELKRHCEQQN